MWEYEIENRQTGEIEIIFGTSYARACEKWHIDANEWVLIASYYAD